MAISFHLEIKKTPTKDGQFPVFIRITKDRKLKRIRTSISLNKLSDWNPKAKRNNWVRSSEKNAASWNEALAKELEAANALYRDNKQDSIDSLAKKLKGEGQCKLFLAYAKQEAADMAAVGRTIAKHYQTFCNRFEAFLLSEGRNDIPFSELSPAVISDFETFLQKESNQKEYKKELKRLHPNYIRTLLVKFRALVNKAINEGLMPADKYPFRQFRIPKEVETGKEALERSEVDAIIGLVYPAWGWMWNTKNAFLFSYYCAGIRVADLLQLRWSNIKDAGTRLEYTMGKTHKHRSIVLVAQAQEILSLYRKEESRTEDYIFPFLNNAAPYAKRIDVDTMPIELRKALFGQIYSKNTLLNRYLKKIAQDAGIGKKLSFHISRHTFASMARSEGISSKVVQQALGHSDLATTERYLHCFSDQEVESAMQEVFTHKESKKEAILRALGELDEETLAEVVKGLVKAQK